MPSHSWQPTRLPCPWDSPGKNTGMGCHFLLQCMKVKSESEVAQSCLTLSDPMDCSLPGFSIRGIFQARVLEWGATAVAGLLEPPERPQGSPASSSVWREDPGLLSRPCRKRRPPAVAPDPAESRGAPPCAFGLPSTVPAQGNQPLSRELQAVLCALDWKPTPSTWENRVRPPSGPPALFSPPNHRWGN